MEAGWGEVSPQNTQRQAVFCVITPMKIWPHPHLRMVVLSVVTPLCCLADPALAWSLSTPKILPTMHHFEARSMPQLLPGKQEVTAGAPVNGC